MTRKEITSLDSLMIFTGMNANVDALALENREYDSFTDDTIGTLKLTRSYDSSFTNTSDEVFVETVPKYKSINNIIELAYSYINNKSIVKSDAANMYIDKTINFLYNYETNLDSNIDNGDIVPMDDIKLFLSSMNNSLYNKQRYYSKSKEIQSISNKGVKYQWQPDGTVFDLYNVDTSQEYELNVGNDYISYELSRVEVEVKEWDGTTYVPVMDYVPTDYDEETDTYTYAYVPRTRVVNVPNYIDSYYDIIKEQLSEKLELFKTKYDEKLLSYYIYDLDSTLPFILNTYSFGQTHMNMNINFDGEFNNWFHNVVRFNVENVEANNTIVSIIPSEKYRFNIVKDENDRFLGKDITTSNRYSFRTNEPIDKLDNISILSPYKLKTIDLSNIAENLTGDIDLLCDYNKKINSSDSIKTNWLLEKGSNLKELIIGRKGVECKVENILGLDKIESLEKIDLIGCSNLIDNPDISKLPNINDIDYSETNIRVFKPAPNSKLSKVRLPETIQSIILNDIEFDSNDSLVYDINQNLTTLEFNNVIGLDSLKFIEKWLEQLRLYNKLDSGLVNYVNLNGLNWNKVNPNILFDLKRIELNEFTGIIDVQSKYDECITRNDYTKLISLFGRNNINNDKSSLNIKTKLKLNAFNLLATINEKYKDIKTELNEFGEYVDIDYINERKYDEFVISILDTDTGNSFIDNIIDKLFNHIEFTSFVNNNKIDIGYQVKLDNYDLTMPSKSEKIDKLEIGDILLYNTNTLLIINKNVDNVNQNFIRLGKINDIDKFIDFINYDFDLSWNMTLQSLEEDLIIPDIDPDNFIEVDYDNMIDNVIEVTYDTPSIDNDNVIEVVYDEPSIDKNNIIEIEYR